MGKNLWAAVIILLVLAVGGYLAYRSYSSTLLTSPAPTSSQQPMEDSGPTPASTTGGPAEGTASADESMSENVVSITSAGFDPKTITIKASETVYWMNKDTKMHNVSSAPHPTHTAYPALNLGDIISLKTARLAFPAKGTYKYHDHLFPNFTGTVVVQ